MDAFSWIIIGSGVLVIIFCIVMTVIDARKHVQAVELLLNFDNVVKPYRYNEPNEFARRCLIILSVYGKWTGFRVKESKHGKGWMVEAENLNGKVYWPSNSIYGDKYYPVCYLDTEKAAAEKMLDVLEFLCHDIYINKKLVWELDERREDIVK